MKKYLYIIFCACLPLAGCSDEDGVSNQPVQGSVTIDGISDSAWTYFSIEKGVVVGTSALGNIGEDAAWAIHADWDIALCGNMIRTNSGTSGKGKGGIIQISDRSFNAIDQAPQAGYITDNDNVVFDN